MRANLGYLDSEFDEFQADTNFDGEIDTDLSNNDVARAPEWTWGIDLMYDHSFLGGTLSWFGNVNYEDDAVWSYTSLPDTPDGFTDDRTLVNAAITFNSADDRWWIRAFGKNLTDEEYRIGELPVANLWVMSFYGEPRTLGIEGGIRFGW